MRHLVFTPLCLVSIACASQASWTGLKIEANPETSPIVRLYLDEGEIGRISTVVGDGVGSTVEARDRYRARLAKYTEIKLKERGLCPNGFTGMTVGGGTNPFTYIITVRCERAGQ